jgi:hypothetical protein
MDAGPWLRRRSSRGRSFWITTLSAIRGKLFNVLDIFQLILLGELAKGSPDYVTARAAMSKRVIMAGIGTFVVTYRPLGKWIAAFVAWIGAAQLSR